MNKPQIRFKGFEDKELSLYTLEDLGTWCKGQPLSKSDIISGGSYPCIHYGELFFYNELVNKINSFTNLTPIRTTSGKELLFPDSDVTPTGLGRCCTTEQPGVILGAVINILSLSVPFNAHYCTLNIVRNNSQIIERISGTTVKHIHPKNLNEVKIAISSDIVEQISISKFFKQLDEMIAEAEREVNRLEKMKQASLQKMFPRPGASIPEIRFNGFVKDWSVTNLGSIGSTYNGLSGKTKEDFGHGEARFVTYMNVFSNPIANPFQVEAVEIDESQNAVKYGDILFTTSSETPEEVGMSSVWQHNAAHVYLNSFCFGFRPTQTVHLNYIAYFLRSPFFRNNMVILAQGISRFNISKHKAMELPVLLPEISEQKAIGEFFRNLDALLSSKHQKLTKLRNIKKACLDKMFVNTSEL